MKQTFDPGGQLGDARSCRSVVCTACFQESAELDVLAARYARLNRSARLKRRGMADSSSYAIPISRLCRPQFQPSRFPMRPNLSYVDEPILQW
jgi:hypothetical protein